MTFPDSSAAVASHVLAVLVAIVWPIWDYFDTQALRAASTPRLRLRYYRQLILLLWVAAAAACMVSGWTTLFTVRGLGMDVAWGGEHRRLWWLLLVLGALFMVVQVLLPAWQGSVKYRKLVRLEPPQMEWLRFFLPGQKRERRWFLALGVSAGVCEEILCRGFLLRYFHTFPFHLELIWAVLLASALFAVHHMYQGVRGVVGSAVTGLVFTGMLLVSGSLWVGIACHSLMDVSVLSYWRPAPNPQDPTQQV